MWFRSQFAAPIPLSRRPKNYRAGRADLRRPEARRLLLEGLENRTLMAFNLLAEYPVGPSPSSVILAPIDADSQLDMVTANSGNASISFLAGQGNGAFDIPPTTSPTLGAPQSVASGDFDGDGVADLVTAGDTSLSFLKGNGDGSFQPPVSISVPWQILPRGGAQPQYLNSVAIGDINDDGTLDLAVTGSTSYWYCPYGCYFYGDNYVNVLIGNGSGGFAPAAVQRLDQSPGSVAIEDLNGDGHKDVIAAISGGLSVLPGDGTGALGSPLNSGSGSPLPSLALSDIDGDGFLDTVLRSGTELIVQKGQGDGTFVPSASVNLGSFPDAAVVGDVNGDGKLDLVAVSSDHTCTDAYYYCYAGYTTKKAVVVLGNGQGGFAAPSDSIFGIIDGTWDAAQYTSLALADLTGDGLPELVATSSGTAEVAQGLWPPADAPFLSIKSVAVVEGDAGTKEITLAATLSAPYTQTVTASFQTAGGTATAGTDYQSSSGSLTFAPGETTQTITLIVYGDRLTEADETFTVLPSNVVNANVGSVGTVTIVDNEPHISINHAYGVDPLTVVEGDVGTTPAVFTVSLAAPYDQEVTVDYYTLTGNTDDIISTTGTLHFAPGETSQTITVEVVGDLINEDLEAFDVYLTNPSPNATIVNGAGYCYIQDNDPAPLVTISDVSRSEGNRGTTSFVFTISLSAASSRWLTVTYATADGTATTADGDYSAATGTVTIPAGATRATITILVRGDKKKEANETFYLNLTGASGATIADSQGVGTILNDDNGGGKGKPVKSHATVGPVADELLTSTGKKKK